MADAISAKTAWALAKAIKGGSKKKGPTNGTATVVRADQDGTHWVRISGSDVETPVNGRTLATAKAGDTVEWSIHDGRLSITGNESQPSVGMREVFQTASDIVQPVVARVTKVSELATLSKNVADAAQQVADAVNQHFFSDTNGVHVTEATQEDWNESHEGANVLLNAAGQLFRDGLVNLLTLTTESGARALTVWDGLGNTASHIRAIIGETITLGPIGSVRMILSASDMALVNESNDEIFSIDSGSTGTSTVALTASLVTWDTTASVDDDPHAVGDTGTAAGTTTVTATINGTEYALSSTYATVTVTAGTGVSVELTDAGVTYVQGLMVETVEGEEGTVTTTYPCELSVEYQHAVTDKALLSLIGSQTVYGDGSGIVSVVNDKWSSSHQTNTSVSVENATTGKAVQLLVGSSGHSRGLFDTSKNEFIIFRSVDDKTVINGPNFSVAASGNVTAGGTANLTNLVVSGWAKRLTSDWSSSNQRAAFIWTENSVTGQSLAFGIANNGYWRGLYDGSESHWIVVKYQSGQVLYYGLHSNFEVTSHTVMSGTTMTGGAGQTGTTDITKSGWYPIAIAGWSGNMRYILASRIYLSASSSGSGTISWFLYNASGSTQTPTFVVYVLWARGD